MDPTHAPLALALVLLVAALAYVLARFVRAGLVASTGDVDRAEIVSSVFVGAITTWLVATATLAAYGALRAFETTPPRVMLLPPVALLLGGLWLFHTSSGRAALAGARVEALIGLQTFRVVVELYLYAVYVDGAGAKAMTFLGHNHDVVVGVSAPLVALAYARGLVGARAAIAWNVLSVGVLLHTVSVGVRALPGPWQTFFEPVTTAIVAEAPYVWIPAFLVPTALLLHVATIVVLAQRRGDGARALVAATA